MELEIASCDANCLLPTCRVRIVAKAKFPLLEGHTRVRTIETAARKETQLNVTPPTVLCSKLFALLFPALAALCCLQLRLYMLCAT